MKLLIGIPALNEEQSIRGIIERTLAAREYIVANSPVEAVEITVVSDGSTDRTAAIAREYEGRIRVIEFPENQGYGAAIQGAWAGSEAELLSFLDADGTCDPRFFADLCRALEEARADVALGCRLNANSRMPLIRRTGNRMFALLLECLSKKKVRDTASGMRVVRRSALRRLYPLPTGLHFTPAMSARAMLADRIGIVEIDMPYAEREGRSKLKVMRDGLRFLGIILSTALLYRPGVIVGACAQVMGLAGATLLALPVYHYFTHFSLEEWMIYRVLVGSSLAQVALLLWAGAGFASRVAQVAMREEVARGESWTTAWTKTPLFWVAVAALVAAAGGLVAESAGQLWETGHTTVHWSRFVASMWCVTVTAILLVFRGVDRLLDLVEKRVVQLARPE